MLTGVFKDARFGPFSNLHTCISLVLVFRFGQRLSWRFSLIYTFSLACFPAFRDEPHAISVSASQTMLTGLLCYAMLTEDLRFVPFSNQHTCISLVEVYRFGQCLGWRFLPI